MPTYEYACTNCGRHLEIVQSFSDDPLEVCEVCEGRLRRVFHPVGVLFKGSGFYRTDSATKANKAPEKTSDGKGEGKTEDKKTDKKETKPDASKPSSKTESKTSEKSA